jgi:eukaryotic-like serine/threonine-protein kinase
MSKTATAGSRILRLLGRLAYLGLILAVFGFTAYFSFRGFVRSGNTRTPEVVGLSLDDAEARLADQGLDLEAAEGGGRYHQEIPAGAVVLQDPAPNTLVKRGTAIEVVRSLGPEQLRVPGLEDKSVTSAQLTLTASGLTLGRSLRVFDDSEPGTVVRQSPAEGQAISPDAPVDVLLSLGSTEDAYVMPDLVYLDYQRIRPFFENRGFRFGSVKFEPYEGAGAGVILRQFPLAGHPVSSDDTISLVVAASPERLYDEVPEGV